LARFDKYYGHHYEPLHVKKRGECIFSVQNAAELRLPQEADVILTSPPYCNRLDLIVQYGPENYFLSALGHASPPKDLIGTTTVRDYETVAEDFAYLTSISEYTSILLNNIRKSRNADDPGYYLKYYTRYFAALIRSIDGALRNLSATGKMYMVTQDNTHRGQLIEIDRVLKESLRKKGWKSRLVKRWERHHLGLRTVSREHAFVRPKQFEKLVVVWR
jgi:DNA modification methylase